MRFKYHERQEYAGFYAHAAFFYVGKQIQRRNPEVLVPVPLHPARQRQRGYNQAEYLAEGIARALRAEVDRHSVRRIRNNPAQALHRHAERWDNVEGIFAVRRPERLAGHHLLLVDDVLTTGATLLSCAETILRAAPDCRLSVAVLAVPQREFGLDG